MTDLTSHKVACMQPYIFPYLGYFQLIKAVDSFVILNDVNYFKKGFIHKNVIELSNKPYTFTIPVKKPSQNKKICEHFIQETWSARNLINTLKHAYKKAPFYEENIEIINIFFQLCEQRRLCTAASLIFKEICQILGIKTNILLSSNFNVNKRGQERIIELCKLNNATQYINLMGGKIKGLYSQKDFKSIDLKFIERTDDWGDYSVIHYLFTKGREKTKNILNDYRLVA